MYPYNEDFGKEYNFNDEDNCVIINIFCDNKKEYKSKDDCKGSYKKEYERKDGKGCVIINVFCDKCKKGY